MAYVDEGIDQRAEVLSAGVDSLVYYAKKDGAAVTADPASAFVTIYDPTAGEKVARVAATIAANGKLSYSRTWELATFPYAEDYCALWEWTVGSVAYSDRQYFDVVRNKLPCLIDESDLLELYPNLVEHMKAVDGATPTLAKFIKRGWSHLLDRIRVGGNRPPLILDRSRLVNPAIHIALHFATAALVREQDDLWDRRQERHMKLYETAVAGLGELRYDHNEDTIAEKEETARPNRRAFNV